MPHHHFFPAAKSDVPPVVPADADESRPEPAPRSKPPTVTPKPPHQATKPQLGPRSSGPLSPSSPTSPRPSSSYVTGRWWNRDATDQTSSVSERQQRDNRDLLLHTTHSFNSYSLCVNMKWKPVVLLISVCQMTLLRLLQQPEDHFLLLAWRGRRQSRRERAPAATLQHPRLHRTVSISLYS